MHKNVFVASGEAWLVIEENIIHIFDNKNEAICFGYLLEKVRHKFSGVYHRYPDGKIHPLMLYPDKDTMEEMLDTYLLIHGDPEYIPQLANHRDRDEEFEFEE